eukprot:1725651-Amphidinium_carterae.1
MKLTVALLLAAAGPAFSMCAHQQDMWVAGRLLQQHRALNLGAQCAGGSCIPINESVSSLRPFLALLFENALDGVRAELGDAILTAGVVTASSHGETPVTRSPAQERD